MKRSVVWFFTICAAAALTPVAVEQLAAIARSRDVQAAPDQRLTGITVDYPLEGSVFPPEFPAPTFLWRDDKEASFWTVEAVFSDGSPSIKVSSRGERMQIGEVDPRCVAPTNKPPALTAEQAAAHTWTPDAETWETIKKRSVERPVTFRITGFADQQASRPVSGGQVSIKTSKDPVGAPIFYRDVPLMPSEVLKGVIKPLAPHAVPLIAWRLRNVNETSSRLLMTGLHSCANCHSFSRDGKTLGLDVDGPQNDKGLYALIDVKPQAAIRQEDVIKWSTFQGRLGGRLRVGFMSQVSPDGQNVLTMINDPGTETRERLQDIQGKYYVANFKDYRFLQVFYPTRGILAWYSRSTGRLEPLPGADDPRYVQTNATWSPDGKYIVFARAEARDPYPANGQMAEFANDPKETQIKYDLYRIPFNGGKGGVAEPIVGASNNGMSNSFPKISPDGRWIVFVKAKNGLLMRPDGQLYIAPSSGGEARRMRCNTPLMNSWHSFSPNGRWMVFSSKSRTPYTQMFLTHIDEQGNDTPAILIENSTAANRAVNIPEFVNIPSDGLMAIDTPAVEFYKVFDVATEFANKGQHEAAAAEWRRAAELEPSDVRVYTNLGNALSAMGRISEAMSEYQKALKIDDRFSGAYVGLGVALARANRLADAIPNFERALELAPEDAIARSNLAAALIETGRFDDAIVHCRKALETSPSDAEAHANLATALARSGHLDDAIGEFEKAIALKPDSSEIHYNLGFALVEKGRRAEAIAHLEKALALGPESIDLHRHLARLLAESGRLDEAIQRLERVVELAPQVAQAHTELGDALYGSGSRRTEAIAQWRQALELAERDNNQQLVSALKARIERGNAAGR